MDIIEIKNKRVLVTGGEGYLGRYLTNKLINLGAEVYSIDIKETSQNDKVKYFKVSLNNEKELFKIIKDVNPELIYHLAASLERTRDFSKANTIYSINLNGTVNLLNALKSINYRNFVFISTSEVYGGQEIQSSISEGSKFIPTSPYSLSKYFSELTLQTFSKINQKHFTILRVFNFFGPQMPQSFFIPQLITKLENNQDFDMTKGEQSRDYTYIDDITDALILASSQKAYDEIFNVCSGTGISIKDIALRFKKIINSKSKINFGAIPYRENEVWNMTGDNSKINQFLGWKPKLTIFDGYKKNNL